MTSLRYLCEGALQVNSNFGFYKSNPDFILVLYSNHTSIMHRFLFNQLLQLAGNYVIVLSPLEGAASDL